MSYYLYDLILKCTGFNKTGKKYMGSDSYCSLYLTFNTFISTTNELYIWLLLRLIIMFIYLWGFDRFWT